MVGVTNGHSIFHSYLQLYIIIGETSKHVESAFPEATQVLRIGGSNLQTKPNGYTDDLFHTQKLLKNLQ
jgi:hypothetical protein